jgi:hypothetical protein
MTLPPRPEVPAEELAAVIMAAQHVLTPRAVVKDDEPNVWRWSGRWFHAHPYAMRRPHDFA